jgi:hypothetical protein
MLPLNRFIEIKLCQKPCELHDPSVIGGDGLLPETLCKSMKCSASLHGFKVSWRPRLWCAVREVVKYQLSRIQLIFLHQISLCSFPLEQS